MKLKPGVILLIAAAACGMLSAQEYEGPTVLSRSGGGVRPYGQRVGEESKVRLYVAAEAIYDYGFLPISTNSNGLVSRFGGQFGYRGSFGVYGTKRWRRTSLGLDYTGAYRGYLKNQYFNGADNFLGMEFGDQLNRKTLVTGTVTAGTASRALDLAGGLTGVPLGNILPTTDIFDARTYFINGGMGISRQLTSRLGIELRAEAFRVERHSTSLISVEGYTPKASISYRLNRRNTIGAIYNFVHYDYPRAFGEANIQVAMGFWGYDINRLWKFEAQGGAFVADTAGTRSVAADPIVQQLLGVRTITEAFSRVVALPNAQLRLLGKTGNSTFTFAAYRGVGAGNGVTLTSSEQSGTLTYGYVLSKNLTASVSASYSSAAGLSTSANRYSTFQSNTGIQYNSPNSISYTFSGLYRHSLVKAMENFSNDSFQIALGVGWSLRDVPFLH